MEGQERGIDQSELNRVIAPEIKHDALYELIVRLTATEKLDTVLEIGSSAGGGSTEAFVAGLSKNPGQPKLFCIEVSKPRFEKLQQTYAPYPFVHCYNRSSVSISEFPSPETVAKFYLSVPSGLVKYPLEQVLDWLRQDIQYVREGGVEAGAIEAIKAEYGIDTFDMVLIDGSEFTGEVEYPKVKGARFILLDDTNTYKCWNVRQALLADPMYDLIADDQTLRNGYSAFRRRRSPRTTASTLPIHFFTIVLNGEPFIRYHEEVFSRLDVPWYWHVVEGVASLNHDTGWSVATGGHISDSFHDAGRSNDGTSAYLDDLAKRFPDNVTVYRKPPGEFWDGKKEMVNAPLPNIKDECLLWQVDNDELWTIPQIEKVHKLFVDQPERSAAYYWCWYFVGPDRIISTRYNYAQNPNQEWLRTWRYTPGAIWAAHEPPILVIDKGDGKEPVNIAKVCPFTQDDMEREGVVFQHFAYTTEAQLLFKEVYYGYPNARAQWRALQEHRGSGQLTDFFGWVSDNTVFDDLARYRVQPVATQDPATGAWTFDRDAGLIPVAPDSIKRPRIVVDGIFWQYLSSGIGRVWQNLFREWTKSGFIDNVIVLDRAGTAPRLPGVHYWTIAKHDYAKTATDSLYLEQVCRDLGADIFVSTYYSTPTSTPSFFSGYDMIPEFLGAPLVDESWKEKRLSILHASGHSMISRNSASDLERLYPEVRSGSTYVTHVGVAPEFAPPGAEQIDAFRNAHQLQGRPYVMMVGERSGFGGYKNGELAFKALATMADDRRPVLICVGGQGEIEPYLTALAPKLDARRLTLSDADLRAAYAGAHALLYPSKYEGFGMPPVESMACGTPAIVCRNSSLPEVVGDAAIYVDENDPADMARAIERLFDPGIRADLVARGFAQASKFTFARMASEMAAALVATHEDLKSGTRTPPGGGWSEMRALQKAQQAAGKPAAPAERAVDAAPAGERPIVSVTNNAPPMHATNGDGQLEHALRTIAAMKKSPFWKARDLTVAVLRKAQVRYRP